MGDGSTMDKIKGRAKEAVGSLVDDDQLKQEGRADQTAGKTKQKVNEVVDKAKEVVTGKDNA